MATKNNIELEMEHIIASMSKMKVDSEEYTNAAKNLLLLAEARSKKPSRFVEYEVVVGAAVNLLGILLILHYEQLNVVSSKALVFLGRRI